MAQNAVILASKKNIKQDMSLLDEEFLATLSEQKDRELYARITALDINELPIDSIEGRVTTGSINLDGTSTVRRTCSLTMTSEVDINEYYWGIKTKFKLDIGLRNKLQGQYAPNDFNIYPDVVWFPQGIYIISSFNTSITTNSCTISLQGKDKMCLLNGELGGQLFASIDFGTEETETRIMREVSQQVSAASSDILMTQTYYKKVETLGESPEFIYGTDTQYALIMDDNGFYYKDGNIYYLQTSNIQHMLSRQKYQLYKKITNPSEFFKPTTKAYKANQFYYERTLDSGYYILDTSAHAANSQHYELIPFYQEDYEKVIYQIPLEQIIREAVHAYAGEPYHNIIINDLDDYGLEQVTYKGDQPLYALRNTSTGVFTQLFFSYSNDSFNTNILQGGFTGFESLTSDTTSDPGTPIYEVDHIFSLVDPGDNIPHTTYTVAKLEYGDDVGYQLTELIYTGDLISSIGDALTTILDKIKTMLGDFEYFYDNDGRFIFQRKRIYVNTSWSQLTSSDDETYVDYYNSDRKRFSFNFEGNRLLSAVQNAPALTNLRNDFVVWGKRKTTSGAEIPIHARYAIDKKPVFYKALNGISYTVNEKYAIEALDISTEFTPDSIIDSIRNFQLSYPLPAGFTRPEKLENGSWTPGWWDIRDWRNYYVLLMDEEPVGTMKFYSSNDENGCIPVNTLPGFGMMRSDLAVWLVDINERGTINTGHGMGRFGVGSRECTFYESHYEGNRIVTTPTETKATFAYPYAGCADTHTYLYFLDEIERYNYQGVYFFNPHFPGISYEEALEDRIERLYAEWLGINQIKIVDWREIIYQMALDFFAAQGCSKENPLHLFKAYYNNEGQIEQTEYLLDDPDHFLSEVAERNPYHYPTGYTGYEQYYTDMQGFWRQLYNPDYVAQEVYAGGEYELVPRVDRYSIYYTRSREWQTQYLSDFVIDFYLDKTNPAVAAQYDELKRQISISYQYLRAINPTYENVAYTDEAIDSSAYIDESIQSIVDSWTTTYKNQQKNFYMQQIDQQLTLLKKYETYLLSSNTTDINELSNRLYWNVNVFNGKPETLNFWIDFLDSDFELASFSVPMVGDRTKVVNEDKAGSIIYKEIPNIILYSVFDPDSNGTRPDYSKLRHEVQEKSGYIFVYLPKGFSQYLTISYRNLSVKNKIDELIYQFAYCIENITLTAIPVYYLQPNTRIFVQDQSTGINGEYIVNRITLPLTYNGTMSISASKAPERLY